MQHTYVYRETPEKFAHRVMRPDIEQQFAGYVAKFLGKGSPTEHQNRMVAAANCALTTDTYESLRILKIYKDFVYQSKIIH